MIKAGRIISASVEKLKSKDFKGLGVSIDVTSVERKEGALFIGFTEVLEYKEDFARMKITGEVLYEDTEKKLKEIEDSFEKNGRLPKDLAEQVLNAVTATGASVGTLLAFAININSPIITQRFKVEETMEHKPPGKAG